MIEKTIVKCPNCEVEGMEVSGVYKVNKPKSITMEEDHAERMSKFTTQSYSSGDISFPFLTVNIPIQIVYVCKHCGYTKVFDREVKK
jgi:hypothetical protein